MGETLKAFLWRVVAALSVASLIVAPAAFAQASTVTANQGRPGAYGSWPIRRLGSSGTATNTAGNTAAVPASTSTSLTANPTACTTAGGASCTIIYASTDWIQWTNLTITIRNSGANPIQNINIEWSPDGTNFEVWDPTTFIPGGTLVAGGIISLAISGNSRRFLRIEARASANTSTVVHITANDG